MGNMPLSESPDSRHKSNVQKGREYEMLAGQFYEQNGFEILERNWHAGHREIDLIVAKKDLVIFVEVKSSSSRKFGHPAERVDRAKVHNLVSAARQYLIAKEIRDTDLRFDVVTFVNGCLEHYPDAFPAE